MVVSSTVSLAIVLTTAQGATNRHLSRIVDRELTRTPPARGSAQNKTPQNQNRGRVNHVIAESVPEDADVVYGMFLINSIPASVLFDSGAYHSFITESFMENITYQSTLLRRCYILVHREVI